MAVSLSTTFFRPSLTSVVRWGGARKVGDLRSGFEPSSKTFVVGPPIYRDRACSVSSIACRGRSGIFMWRQKEAISPILSRLRAVSLLLPPATHNYVKITAEAVVSLNPDVILDMVQAVAAPVTLIAGNTKLAEDPSGVWRDLDNVRAVEEGRVYPLRDTQLIHSSQFVGKTARQIAEFLHPEAFED